MLKWQKLCSGEKVWFANDVGGIEIVRGKKQYAYALINRTFATTDRKEALSLFYSLLEEVQEEIKKLQEESDD